jgi:MYXO-CTERM domain-containing protein
MNRALLTTAFLLGACGTDDPELGQIESELDISVFKLPSMSIEDRAEIVRRYDDVDPTNKIPRGLLEDALLYFDVNQTHIPKKRYVVVIDMSLYSGKDRYWLVDLQTGAVEPHKVSHGNGSDPDNNGYADTFGNVSGSNKTSLGFYLTGEIYDGTHQHSMRLDGLSPNGSPNGMANTNARSRLIVVHEASYVSDTNTSQQGRSNGCPALDPDIEVAMVDRIHGGSLMYIATKQLAAPVGRASCGDAMCDGTEDPTSCAVDCAGPEDPGQDDGPSDDPGTEEDPSMNDESAGCSAGGGGAGFALVLAAAGLRRRRRS